MWYAEGWLSPSFCIPDDREKKVYTNCKHDVLSLNTHVRGYSKTSTAQGGIQTWATRSKDKLIYHVGEKACVYSYLYNIFPCSCDLQPNLLGSTVFSEPMLYTKCYRVQNNLKCPIARRNSYAATRHKRKPLYHVAAKASF